MKTTNLAIALKNKVESKIIRKNNERVFLEFINRKGMPYEKILLKKYYDRVISILKKENPPPYELEIQPTSKCNANCSFCWAKYFQKLEDKLNTKEAMDKIINEILNFEKDGFKIDIIKFCGSTGEPLLNPLTLYAIDKIYGKRYLRSFTNGILLAENKNNPQYLKTISKLNKLNVSLDAASTSRLHELKHGSSNITLEDILAAMNKIRNLSENKISVEASYIILNENYKEIVEFVKKVKNYGAANTIRFRINLIDRTVSMTHGDEINKLIEETKAYDDKNFKVFPIHSEKEIKQKDYKYFTSKESGFKCFTSRIWGCIGSNCHLYPCGHIVAGDVKNYGSLLEKSFREIWDSKTRKKLVKELPMEKCSVCSPFSLRVNRFLTHISKWPIEEISELYKKHIIDKSGEFK